MIRLVEGVEIPAGPPVRAGAQHAEREIAFFGRVRRAVNGFGVGEVKIGKFDGGEVAEGDAAGRRISGCFT
jgi:hypothetical protein